MAEVHEGICGAQQASPSMRWILHRYGFYWPTIGPDCVAYAKGYEACQRHSPVQRAPAVDLKSIIKPRPFYGWAMDLIGMIYPPSSKKHVFIILATDYFTKWVEAKPLKVANQEEVISFIQGQC
ncbi:unnamed protein product [Linum trigynum]|uniref:Gypsy retrotransposon integrase-like protein 1 n=1 Tax=Linum trigynum TaxID=586398 RepID=A0AAV2GC63_9ROSI